MVRLALLITLLPALVYSQAPFELENRKALKLNESRLKILTNKRWNVRKVKTNNPGGLEETSASIRYLKYHPDGTFTCGLANGTWLILEGRYIKHTLDRKAEIRANFGGTFGVISLTDTSLVLAKVLTSSHDMKRTLYLTVWSKKVVNPSFKHRLYYSKLETSQIDSLSQLSTENLFEYNYKFTGDSLFFPTKDSLYRIRRKYKK